MRSISRSALAVAASLSLLTMAPAVLAQAKPKTLSGSAGSGKVMSFKELESCLKEQDGMADRVKQLQARRDTMDAERKGIQAEAEALKSGGEEINALAAKVKDFNERMKAQGERVAAWKARSDELAANDRSGPAVDRQRRELEKDRTDLAKNEAALDAESKALGVERERLTAGYNQRAEAQAAKATDWNARSKALDNDFQAYEDQRLDWRQRCANRPYLEEHEKIIRSGK